MTVNMLKTSQSLIPTTPVDAFDLAINTNEVTTDVGMLALHFGIHRDLVEDLRRVLHMFFPKGWAFAHGDGYNCWGEDMGTDVNDEDTAHVVTYFDGQITDAIQVLIVLHEHGVPLVPMAGQSRPSLNGPIACLTDAEDWSDCVATWRIQQGALVGKIG